MEKNLRGYTHYTSPGFPPVGYPSGHRSTTTGPRRGQHLRQNPAKVHSEGIGPAFGLPARQRRDYTIHQRRHTHAMARSRRFLQVLALLLLGLTVTVSAYAESPYPYSSNSLDWSSSRTDSPYYDDLRHKPGYQNSNAGYLGSDLPLREYNPDAPRYGNERTAPMPPLDGGMYSGKPNPYCTGSLCGSSR